MIVVGSSTRAGDVPKDRPVHFNDVLATIYHQLGVPTVYCAPGDIRNCHTLEERVELQEYFDGIVACAAFLARIGELERPGIQPADGRNLRGNRQ